ncbi:response regulator transcription factor [Glaciimonas soli]|uniref:Response regulator n=1 Tax=Glaciimonas soli TaxID=2590999 RepID=A0A843YYF8_9BURK|nr:response regulator transcription factor [Glaciimonas soli]MQR02508.1 response regulator [Glaciimonas soli]
MRTFTIRVVIADDHPAFLLGVIQALAAAPTIELVGSAQDATSLIAVLKQTPCDVLITDYVMPKGEFSDGLAMLTYLGRHYPDLKIGVMTMMDNPVVLRTLLAQGVVCILSKADDPSCLIPAIHAAYSGGRYFSPIITRLMQTQEAPDSLPTLSQSEAEVVRLFVSGMTVNAIAAQQHRSKQTVSGHKTNAMRKLGIKNDAELFKYAIEIGLVPSSSAAAPQ